MGYLMLIPHSGIGRLSQCNGIYNAFLEVDAFIQMRKDIHEDDWNLSIHRTQTTTFDNEEFPINFLSPVEVLDVEKDSVMSFVHSELTDDISIMDTPLLLDLNEENNGDLHTAIEGVCNLLSDITDSELSTLMDINIPSTIENSNERNGVTTEQEYGPSISESLGSIILPQAFFPNNETTPLRVAQALLITNQITKIQHCVATHRPLLISTCMAHITKLINIIDEVGLDNSHRFDLYAQCRYYLFIGNRILARGGNICNFLSTIMLYHTRGFTVSETSGVCCIEISPEKFDKVGIFNGGEFVFEKRLSVPLFNHLA